MITSLAALSIVGLILVFSEFLLKNKIIHGEIARKFVHIIVGSFIASWLFYLDVRQIQVLSAILLLGVIVSKFFKVFGAVHGVTRKTWGEAFFAVGIGLSATFAQNKWVFAAAILHMSIADGFAAVIGTKFGKRSGYSVLGQYKTLAGTLTFFALSSLIMTWLVFVSPAGIREQAWLIVIWLPLVTTLTENVAIQGSDNIAVPMVVIAVLYIVGQIY